MRAAYGEERAESVLLRGAISVALALSLPDTPYRTAIVGATYVIVIFSVVVQGLTIGRVLRRTVAAARPARSSG